MFKLHRKVEYALIALKHMHAKRPGELTSAKEVSKIYSTPFDATSRSLQLMAQNGLLKSNQGSHGGYQILKDINEYSFLDFFRMIMGPLETINCIHPKDSDCNIIDTCNIMSPMNTFNTRLKEFFGDLNLKDLLESNSKIPVKLPETDNFLV